MLQNKDITKVQEIKTYFKNSWLEPEFLSKHFNLLHFSKTSLLYSSVKECGVPFWDLLKLILIFPFMNISSVGAALEKRSNVETIAQKDTYYRALGNQKMDWRGLLFLIVKRYLSMDKKFTAPTDGYKCLIFDDSDLEKRGKKIEGVSKIYNHVQHRFIFGYKLLVAGYWNGCLFIPVDFSFHRENKENKIKKYGLSKKEYKQQKKTERDNKLPVFKRFKELNVKKSEMVVEMFKRITKRKIDVEYILLDSWFTSMSLIKKLLKVNKQMHVIGMYKYNSKLNINGKESSINQLRKNAGKVSRSRSLNLYYHQFVGELDGVTVKVFLSKRGKRGVWHTILTTDTKLNFTKAMDIYSIRWTIEVFFKEAKQLLGLGKCQSTNFDVQVAQTTIIMIQYLLISLKYRMEAYETIGGMFKNIKQDYIEHTLNKRLMLVIAEILVVLDLLVDDIDINEIAKKIASHGDLFSFNYKQSNNASVSNFAA